MVFSALLASSEKRGRSQLNCLFIPNSYRTEDTRIELHVLDDFLTAAECTHLIGLIDHNLRPSELTHSEESQEGFRTNWSSDLDELDDTRAKQIDFRMSRLLGFEPRSSEFMQGQRYDIGHQFRPHTDSFDAEQLKMYGQNLGQRTYTMLVYLNDVEEGGDTMFPLLDLQFKARAGTALIWNNLTADGSPNCFTLHEGRPVIKGAKYVVTKWFRSTIIPPRQIKEAAEYRRAFTKIGLRKMSIPAPLFHILAAFYHSHITSKCTEIGSEHLIFGPDGSPGSDLIELSSELREITHNTLQPIVQEWAGIALAATYVYGVRVYRRGAILAAHRDRPETHVLGVLMNIDQDVEEDWPLVIEDNTYREYHVKLRPGEMVMYEGARLRHGRPFPLSGSRYANVFSHFVPVE